MSNFRMTSDPTNAAKFADSEELGEAVQFARDHRAANFLSMIERSLESAAGTFRVLLPTFCGDLWVARN